MLRFMMITFGLLGWAWWELSGGSQFEVGPIAQAKAIEAQKLEAASLAVARTDTSNVDLTGLTSDAEKVSLVTTSDAPAPQAVVAVALADTLAPDTSTPVVTQAAAAEVVQNAPEAPSATVMLTRRDVEPVAVEVATAAEDIREVSGSRVNMRSGPGTEYAVVTRLRRGDQVIVISANDDGWLEIRDLNSNERGWMADFLLTASN